jgi:hypothetical protein
MAVGLFESQEQFSAELYGGEVVFVNVQKA